MGSLLPGELYPRHPLPPPQGFPELGQSAWEQEGPRRGSDSVGWLFVNVVSKHVDRFSAIEPSWDKPQLMVRKHKTNQQTNFNKLLDSACWLCLGFSHSCS